MRLIGVNRTPYTQRVATTLKLYGVPYEQSDLSGFGNRAEVRTERLARVSAKFDTDVECLNCAP